MPAHPDDNPTPVEPDPDDEWQVISRYTRAQAIADGVLVDVSELAREAGFRHPVAVTAAVWHEVIVPDESGRVAGQSETGRLWDMLACLRHAIGRAEGGTDLLHFTVIVIRAGRVERQRLKALCHPGDEGEPVLTLMLPEED